MTSFGILQLPDTAYIAPVPVKVEVKVEVKVAMTVAVI
jgi:hypothetical protein